MSSFAQPDVALPPEPREAPPSPLKLFLARHVFPEHVLLVVFVLLLAVLWAIFGTAQWRGLRGFSVRTSFGTMVGLIIFAFLSRGRALWRHGAEARRAAVQDALMVIRQLTPFVLAVLGYENMHDMTNLIRPDTLDQPLLRADQWLFGVQPTLWMERNLTVPWFTDYMVFVYSLYFILPGLLVFAVYLRKHERYFRCMCLSLLGCLVVGFIGYITVPAIGPRFVLKHAYQDPVLRGWLLPGNASEIFRPLESVMRDCFPSLHTAISSVALFWAWRLRAVVPGRSAWFWIYLPLITSLWLSTVYLRQHWVVDVFAGWALAALSVTVTPLIVARYLRARDAVLAAAGEESEWAALAAELARRRALPRDLRPAA